MDQKKPISGTNVLAVSSGGGHWSELRRLSPCWADAKVTYVVTDATYKADLQADETETNFRFYTVMDANADQKMRLIFLAAKMLFLVLWIKPDAVISTGAAPGFFAIRFAKLFGAKTVWVDSIANAEEMSKSANLARKHCDLWLSQWPHLAKEVGAEHAGAVM